MFANYFRDKTSWEQVGFFLSFFFFNFYNERKDNEEFIYLQREFILFEYHPADTCSQRNLFFTQANTVCALVCHR